MRTHDHFNLLGSIWQSDSPDVTIERDCGCLVVSNTCGETRHVDMTDNVWRRHRYHHVTFKGSSIAGDGPVFQLCDADWQVLGTQMLNSESVLTTNSRRGNRCRLLVLPHATVRISCLCTDGFRKASDREDFLLEGFNNRILIITPDYPTLDNKYLCAFVHTRLQAYRDAGIEFDVACSFNHRGICRYTFEGIAVTRMADDELRTLLQKRTYDTIIVHFIDLHYKAVFDDCDLSGARLLFWCHGAESLFWDAPEFTTPYFSAPRQIGEEERGRYRRRTDMLREFNEMPNVTWIPVSDFVRKRGESLLGFRYRDYHVISNYIDPDIFAFQEKDPELRKRVFFVRKFDNYSNYAIDISVACILDLSTRPCFKDMEFSIFGTGEAHDMLLEPLAGFPNVHIEKRYLTHEEIAAEHKRNGIALFPTRFDAQGVSMCEAAASGLAVVSTRRDSVADFLPDDCNLLAEAEDHRAYADIIERLYDDPEYFLTCSRACHEKVTTKCGYENTIAREITLIEGH